MIRVMACGEHAMHCIVENGSRARGDLCADVTTPATAHMVAAVAYLINGAGR